MIGKFLFGAFVGGVTVAGGLVTASLITPILRNPGDAAPVEIRPAKDPQAPVSDVGSSDDVALDPVAAKEPQGAVPSEAGMEPSPTVVIAAEPAADLPDAEPDVVVAPLAKAAPEAVADAQPADDVLTPAVPEEASTETVGPTAVAEPEPANAPATGATTTLPSDDGPAVATGAPAPDPATAVTVVLPPPEVIQTPPPVAAAPAEADVTTPTVAEVPAPALPTGPAQPPAPDQDAVVAAIEVPAPAPQGKDIVAPDAATADQPATEAPPDAVAGSEVTPAPESGPDVAILEPEPAPPAQESPPAVEATQVPEEDTTVVPGTVLPDATDAPVSTLKPATRLRDRAEGVIIGRLPKIGSAPPADTLIPDDPAANDAEGAAEPDPRPMARYAADFENPDAKPLFSIVLIDTGDAALNRGALADLPFPVSFALDPLDPDTPERAAIYRAADKEVVMLATGIVEGARASDVEVAFQSMERGLPEAVAVMDLPEKRFQDNRPLASIVVPVIAAQGRGLVTWDQGLNAADQVARREDLAAAVVFRPIDGAGEDRTAMRRALDRAAFKSAQDGRVTVVGRTSPETVAALLEWTVEGRAAMVALAPLSAVLTVE